MDKKYAVLSMDIEDWHQLYYFKGKADTSFSMLDGFTNYLALLDKYGVKTTFFVLGDIAELVKDELVAAHQNGHEIACHGLTHTRPVDLSAKSFRSEIREAKQILEKIVGEPVNGYRAPCYGIDNQRYKIVEEEGFTYSSSKMDVKGHPLYGELDLSEFESPMQSVYVKENMTEFALSTQKFLGKDIAVSGGGWLRLLPWGCLMKPLVKKYLKRAQVYTLYIHPFELSRKKMPKVEGTSLLTNVRARRGLGKVEKRMEKLIKLLQKNGFEFVTFTQLKELAKSEGKNRE